MDNLSAVAADRPKLFVDGHLCYATKNTCADAGVRGSGTLKRSIKNYKIKATKAVGRCRSFRTLYRVVSRFLRDPEPAQPTVRRIDYSPRQVSIWLSRPTEELPSQPVKDYLITLLRVCPELQVVRDLSLSFKQLMESKQVDQLDEWLARCESTGFDALRQFVRGLRQDYAAVRQAFCSEWSNGQVEGQVNRLKTIKRAMYGRAGFELLRRRVVMTSG